MRHWYTLPLGFLAVCRVAASASEPGGGPVRIVAPNVTASPAGTFHFSDHVRIKTGFYSNMLGVVDDATEDMTRFWIELDKAPRTVYEKAENLEEVK